MSEHDHAPTAGRTSSTPAKSSKVEPKSDNFAKVNNHRKISNDDVEVTIQSKTPLTVGMTVALLGLPGAQVKITRVFAGGAKGRVSFPDIAKEIDHHTLVVLSPTVAAADVPNGHQAHGSKDLVFVTIIDTQADGDGALATVASTTGRPVTKGMTGHLIGRSETSVVIESVSGGRAKARITGLGQESVKGALIALDTKHVSAQTSGIGGGPR